MAAQPPAPEGGRGYPGENGENPIPAVCYGQPQQQHFPVPFKERSPVPGAACIPCRSFPAHSPCHSSFNPCGAGVTAIPGLMAHTGAAQPGAVQIQVTAVPYSPSGPQWIPVPPWQCWQPSSRCPGAGSARPGAGPASRGCRVKLAAD